MRDLSRLSGQYNLCSKIDEPLQREMRLIEQVPHLEGVAEAELELPFRGVGSALSVDPSEGTARRPHVRVVIVGVVGEVEGLSSEDKLMVFMVWNDLEAFLERGAKALEAGAIDQASRSARSERPQRRRREGTRLEPLVRVLATGELVVQNRLTGGDPELVARARTNTGTVIVLRDCLRTARLSLERSGELPVPQRRAHKCV